MRNKQETSNMQDRQNNRSNKKNGNIAIKLGLLLIAAALLLCGGNFWTAARAEQAADRATAELLELIPSAGLSSANKYIGDEQEIPDHILNPDMAMPDQRIDGMDYIGVLTIDSLGLTLPIIADWDMSNLKYAPCRFSGSAYTNDLVIAAHNYPAHFGHLANLHIGDSISLCDIDGFRFDYSVAAAEVITATAPEDLYSGDWDLTLFTCTIGGQNRLCIRCVTAQ